MQVVKIRATSNESWPKSEKSLSSYLESGEVEKRQTVDQLKCRDCEADRVIGQLGSRTAGRGWRRALMEQQTIKGVDDSGQFGHLKRFHQLSRVRRHDNQFALLRLALFTKMQQIDKRGEELEWSQQKVVGRGLLVQQRAANTTDVKSQSINQSQRNRVAKIALFFNTNQSIFQIQSISVTWSNLKYDPLIPHWTWLPQNRQQLDQLWPPKYSWWPLSSEKCSRLGKI